MPQPAADWNEGAACAPGSTYRGVEVDPEWWFPKSGTATIGRLICTTVCPVQLECDAYARRHELAGIWGGTSEEERYGHYITHKPRYGE